MGAIESQRYTRLNARQQACKEINEMFGLNISVKYRDTNFYSSTEGENFSGLHNNVKNGL